MPLRKEVVEIIEIDWDGPFALTEVSTLAENSDYFDESKWQEYGGDHLL